ncbi:hypothetical protein [[Kitasatospora] papulosa]|uniref:hypothetical protein n=1 Tax=[Kitasatospora] papulosa TaxID=1464011 RepID=UPI003628292F
MPGSDGGQVGFPGVDGGGFDVCAGHVSGGGTFLVSGVLGAIEGVGGLTKMKARSSEPLFYPNGEPSL